MRKKGEDQNIVGKWGQVSRNMIKFIKQITILLPRRINVSENSNLLE
jgi:hypothetical protein